MAKIGAEVMAIIMLVLLLLSIITNATHVKSAKVVLELSKANRV